MPSPYSGPLERVREIAGPTVVLAGELPAPDLLVGEGQGQQGVPARGHAPRRGQLSLPAAGRCKPQGQRQGEGGTRNNKSDVSENMGEQPSQNRARHRVTFVQDILS